MKRLRFVSIAIMTAFGLAACGDDDGVDSSDSVSGVTTTTVAGADAANDADVVFAQGMVPHHGQAIEMAEIALDPAAEASPPVIDLATRIQQAQGPEIELMTGWLATWGEPTAMDEVAGHEMSSMDGMMSDADMDALTNARGPDFDKMWMEMMIAHHQGAISMAETVKSEGINPDVLALADQIIIAQQAEIQEMTALLEM